ncbi:hypothetical protein [Flavobacterium sp.]
MKAKKIWIDNIINSAGQVTKATPSTALWLKIQNEIQTKEKVSPQKMLLVAASIVILVLLNITALKSKTVAPHHNAANYITFTISENNQLYQ